MRYECPRCGGPASHESHDQPEPTKAPRSPCETRRPGDGARRPRKPRHKTGGVSRHRRRRAS